MLMLREGDVEGAVVTECNVFISRDKRQSSKNRSTDSIFSQLSAAAAQAFVTLLHLFFYLRPRDASLLEAEPKRKTFQVVSD